MHQFSASDIETILAVQAQSDLWADRLTEFCREVAIAMGHDYAEAANIFTGVGGILVVEYRGRWNAGGSSDHEFPASLLPAGPDAGIEYLKARDAELDARIAEKTHRRELATYERLREKYHGDGTD